MLDSSPFFARLFVTSNSFIEYFSNSVMLEAISAFSSSNRVTAPAGSNIPKITLFFVSMMDSCSSFSFFNILLCSLSIRTTDGILNSIWNSHGFTLSPHFPRKFLNPSACLMANKLPTLRLQFTHFGFFAAKYARFVFQLTSSFSSANLLHLSFLSCSYFCFK